MFYVYNYIHHIQLSQFTYCSITVIPSRFGLAEIASLEVVCKEKTLNPSRCLQASFISTSVSSHQVILGGNKLNKSATCL